MNNPYARHQWNQKQDRIRGTPRHGVVEHPDRPIDKFTVWVRGQTVYFTADREVADKAFVLGAPG